MGYVLPYIGLICIDHIACVPILLGTSNTIVGANVGTGTSQYERHVRKRTDEQKQTEGLCICLEFKPLIDYVQLLPKVYLSRDVKPFNGSKYCFIIML